MKVTRVFSDDRGESHFEDIDIPLKDAGTIGYLSEAFPASKIIFRTNDANYDYDWHCAPQRQYIVLLDGEIQIETSDCEIRRFKGGEILLVEDVTGKGHRTKNVTNEPRHSIFITLD